MITYSTNWMGPVNTDWIKENGDHWCAGRIDIYGASDYPDEVALPPLYNQDWHRLTNWLDDVETETALNLQELVEMYEKDHPPLKWLKHPFRG
jgi:hypothetical protein